MDFEASGWIRAHNITLFTSELILLFLSAITINTSKPVPLAAIHTHVIRCGHMLRIMSSSFPSSYSSRHSGTSLPLSSISTVCCSRRAQAIILDLVFELWGLSMVYILCLLWWKLLLIVDRHRYTTSWRDLANSCEGTVLLSSTTVVLCGLLVLLLLLSSTVHSFFLKMHLVDLAMPKVFGISL